MKPNTPLRDKTAGFLKALSITASITEAAAAVRVNRSWHYERMKTDPDYPARFAEALAQGDEAMEDELTSRANHGVFEPLVYKGEFQFEQVPVLDAEGNPVWWINPVTGLNCVRFENGKMLGVWVKSDGLLMFRQRGRYAKYRQNFTEITGANGGAILSTLQVEFIKPKE